jgi:hypothetical protein
MYIFFSTRSAFNQTIKKNKKLKITLPPSIYLKLNFIIQSGQLPIKAFFFFKKNKNTILPKAVSAFLSLLLRQMKT